MAMQIHAVPLGFDNAYLLRGTQSVLIDGGAPGSARLLRSRFDALGLLPKDRGALAQRISLRRAAPLSRPFCVLCPP